MNSPEGERRPTEHALFRNDTKSWTLWQLDMPVHNVNAGPLVEIALNVRLRQPHAFQKARLNRCTNMRTRCGNHIATPGVVARVRQGACLTDIAERRHVTQPTDTCDLHSEAVAHVFPDSPQTCNSLSLRPVQNIGQVNAAAQFQLGSLYRLGLGVDADPRKAKFWFEKSAAQGNAKAARALKRLAATVPPTEKKVALRGNAASTTPSGADLSALPKRPMPEQDWLALAAARDLPQTVVSLLRDRPEGTAEALAAAIRANKPQTVSAILDAMGTKPEEGLAPVAAWLAKPGHEPVLAAVFANHTSPCVTADALSHAAHACNADAVRRLAPASVPAGKRDVPLAVDAVLSCPDAKALLPLLDPASLSEPDVHGRTSLWYAAYGSSPATVSYLLQQNVEAGTGDAGGLTPVHAASLAGRADNLELLLARTGKADDVSGQGLTPLMLAAASGCTDCIVALLAQGGDMDAKDENGNSALMFAARSNQGASMKILINAGANPAARNENGDTPEKAWARLRKTP
jgi:hypothetical protein